MREMNYVRLLTVLVSAFVLSSLPVQARPRTTVKQQSIRAENPRQGREWLALPFAFVSDGLGFVYGVGGGAKGYCQDQLLVGGSIFGGPEDVCGGVLGIWDYRPPWTERFFLTATGSYGHYPNQRAYVSQEYRLDKPRRGSNDSGKDDYVEVGGESNWFDIKLEYVLPLGAARSSGIMTYHLTGGMLQGRGTGGNFWNPFRDGVTTMMVRQNNQRESFETEYGELERVSHPIEFGIGYDNTDYPPNPSTGSSQIVSVKRDFGWGDAPFDWTFIEFEASKYVSLGDSRWARQRVFAFNAWTGDCPTWRETINGDRNIEIVNRPPQYDGATLGGFYRLRAYPSNRFNDRSAVYATVEYR
jgi:hypothetical protein